ncbi:hypothetical protein [Candidatus Nitrotoga fabula]|uniref:hypothetical protein n=1 Tax=Candidatus Nitrotoga fabula TaxID=2182327 RepID=UPI001BB4814C|nr:hypothetical protein [Candidatus Nitrotoga fabula]
MAEKNIPKTIDQQNKGTDLEKTNIFEENQKDIPCGTKFFTAVYRGVAQKTHTPM